MARWPLSSRLNDYSHLILFYAASFSYTCVLLPQALFASRTALRRLRYTMITRSRSFPWPVLVTLRLSLKKAGSVTEGMVPVYSFNEPTADGNHHWHVLHIVSRKHTHIFAARHTNTVTDLEEHASTNP